LGSLHQGQYPRDRCISDTSQGALRLQRRSGSHCNADPCRAVPNVPLEAFPQLNRPVGVNQLPDPTAVSLEAAGFERWGYIEMRYSRISLDSGTISKAVFYRFVTNLLNLLVLYLLYNGPTHGYVIIR